MNILTKKKTTKDFEEKLEGLARNTRENIQASINNFKKFVHRLFGILDQFQKRKHTLSHVFPLLI